MACGVSGSIAQVFVASDGLVINSCSGTFYDSGGAAGNYGNSETFTVVLCPTGGSGAGPASSVTFTQFAVQPLAGSDILVVYNGATTAAPILATGSSTNDLTGQSFLATGATGCLTFQWTSNATVVASGWAATIITGPEAGVSGSRTVCDNGSAFNLITLLTGSPDPGGAWTGPNGLPVAATFTPGSSASGIYTYTVLGTPPCAAASATATITQVVAPNAGTSDAATICSSDAPFPMRPLLGGTPAATGSWTGPVSGVAHAATYTPATDISGVYTYTVLGTAPCLDATATLTITERQAPNAGTNGTRTVCSTDGNFQLSTSLGGTPDAGGTWTTQGGGAFSGTFIPGTSSAGVYTYTVAGLAPCANAIATVTVTVNDPPNAGSNAQVIKCSNASNFSLFDSLGGTPAAGGTWVGPTGLAHPVTYNMATDVPGAYTYTVAGAAPCASASAVVTVSIVQQPVAGNNGTFTTCSNGPSFGLFALLGGSPNATGSWTTPASAPHSGTFAPGTDVAGAYTYTVVGTAPCANATATVTITVVSPPNAGTNGTITICSDASNVNLFTLLGGSPAITGTWTRPDGTAHNGTYIPATQPGGSYTYTVVGTSPCASASSVVQVNRVLAPNAGINGSITVCSTNGPFNLITALGGTPNGSGTWLGPSMTTVLEMFTPGTSTPGTYTYVVQGTSPCVNDTAFATVNVIAAPNAGNNATITVCSSAAQFALITALGGTPQAGGSWTRPDGTALPSGNYQPGISQVGGYTYTVAGTTPCLSASAVLVVNENRQPVAGTSAAFQRCSTDGPVQLFTILGGTPDAGGVWTGPGGASTGVFIPGTSMPGIYTYTVTGVAPCTNATATVTATVNQGPDAGSNGTATVCADLASIDLFPLLGGTPDVGGTWVATNSTGHLTGSTFTPPGLPPGTYDFTYTVDGIGLCAADVSTVQVIIVPALNAGTNGALNVCRTNASVDLFTGLTGSPQTGGTWADLSATGALSGQIFNATMVTAGTYTFNYTLAGTPSCAASSAQVSVTVNSAPNAGQNGSTTTCSNSAAFNMLPFLGGSPQGGGDWFRGAVAHGASYDPAVDISGTFTYRVLGAGPCANATATLTVTEVIAPNAGTSANTSVCSNSTQFNMTSRLGGTPQAGTWSFNSQPHGPLFIPGVDPQGVYIFTVVGQTPCANATSSLSVSVETAASAGANGTSTVCSNNSVFLLISVLVGAQPGGTWVGPDALPHDGVYTPGTSMPGAYVYTVTGDPPCLNSSATATIIENRRPVAGTNGSLNICSNGGSVQLITGLNGTPDASGSWTGPGASASNGVFVPGTSTVGTYTYRVVGAAPCTIDSSQVVVTLAAPPNAGGSNSIFVCNPSQGFNMITRLTGTPAAGGVWTGPAPSTNTMDGFFIPGNTPPGTYTYTVPGTGTCPNTSSTLTIGVNPASNAGENGNATLCSTGGLTPLFPYLGPSAQTGGGWNYRPTHASHPGVFNTASDPVGVYVYTVLGLPGCPSDSNIVNVAVNIAPNAGSGNALITICDDDDPINMFTLLIGATPNPISYWVSASGASHSNFYLPGVDTAGVFVYTSTGVAPCPNATAEVNVIEQHAPDAGSNGARQVCSSDPEFPLFDVLSGSPETGGDWYDPDGVQVGDNYTPGYSQPGIYKYKIMATAPCSADSATVNIIETPESNAGINTVAPLCSSDGVIALIDLLGGNPDTDGSWTLNNNAIGPNLGTDTAANGAYTYTVLGDGPCDDKTAQVQITISQAPNAGSDAQITTCVGAGSVNLLAALGTSVTVGGTWTNVNSAGVVSPTGQLNISGVTPGTYNYIYTLTGAGSCGNASSTVMVTVTNALNAGNNSDVTVCETQSQVVLFDLLTGNPQGGGTWQDLGGSGALIGGTVFDATAVPVGSSWMFKYLLSSSATCPADSAIVTVNVVDAPFAGANGGTTVCSSSASFNLIIQLNSNPDAGGSWFNNVWAPHPATFNPGSEPTGTFHYVVAAIAGCPADTATTVITVRPAAIAGIASQNYATCSNDGVTVLFDLLGPTAQTGGSWTFNGNPHVGNGIYTPAIDAPGTYTYTVTAQAPCAPATANIIVAEPIAPNTGCDGAGTLCSSGNTINLFTLLGCGPQTGGVWKDPDGNIHTASFDPSNDAAGSYTYLITGSSPCESDSSVVVMTVVVGGNAGVPTTLNVCTGIDSLNVFAALGPNAAPGGSWTDVNSSGALAGNVFDPSSAGVGTWILRYSFAANPPCSAASSDVTVVVGLGSNPGTDSSAVVCGSDAQYILFNALGGNPDGGGVWSSPAGSIALVDSVTGALNATLILPGNTETFVYSTSDAQCGNQFATVTVTTSSFPNAGIGGSVQYCTTAAPFDLFSELGGTPELNGTWTGPQPGFNGTFDPSTDPAGNYSYIIPGNNICPDGVATLALFSNSPADPGQDASVLVCDTTDSLGLLPLLSGTPQATGTWQDLDGTGELDGGN